MRTESGSFQLEATVPGIFLLQGWLGGVLAAFVYVVAICLDQQFNFSEALVLTPFVLVFASILGVIKATLMWTPYRLKKIQPRAALRVAITSVATGLFAVTTAYLIGPMRPNEWAAWVLTLLLGGLPTAILIGSKVKPWELFTFGSIAGYRPRTVWGTLGTLPLRFLSLGAFAFWILMFACQRERGDSLLDVAVGFSVPLIYFLFSAYLTFRSPRKTILLVIGLVMNLPAVFTVWVYVNYSYIEFASVTLFNIGVICLMFVVPWAIFIAARLTVRTPRTSPTDWSEVHPGAHEQRNHDCLGSRFLEWQQRVA